MSESMKGGNRKFRNDAVQHIYQISNDFGVIFYDDIDRLVFFTISSVYAQKYGIVVLAMDLMFTHFHESVRSINKKQMNKYMQDKTSVFARLYNVAYDRKGSLFRHSYGSTSKISDKDIRTNLAYVSNNAVEKKLYSRAEEDRWSFLAYFHNSHPFSQGIDRHSISPRLRMAMKKVDEMQSLNKYLGYGLLWTMFKRLNDKEKEELTDYIVSKYMFIDFEEAIRYFGSYGTMLTALYSNTGNEYKIKEKKDGKSDVPYRQMVTLCRSNRLIGPGMSPFRLPEDKKMDLINEILSSTDADKEKIGKFLHMELD